jgi:WD40 repeat protein
VWDCDTGALVSDISGQSNSVTAIIYYETNRGGPRLASGSIDRLVKVPGLWAWGDDPFLRVPGVNV